MTASPNKKTIYGIQFLRGLAALGVVFCHFGSKLTAYPWLSWIFCFGQDGVHVFFFISGFIIVYSLTQAAYQPSQFFRFLLKRSIRIDPSYYVTIILTLVLFKLFSLSPSFRGRTTTIIPGQLLAHIFYVVPFTKWKFYNHIFWTLCIEFQFYLIVGLLYFLFDSRLYRNCFLIAFALTSFIPFTIGYSLVFNYAAIFALGISLVNLYNKEKNAAAWYHYVFPLLFLLVAGYQFGLAIALFLLLSAGILLFVKSDFRPLNFLGNISYSLYLTHSLVFLVVTSLLKKLQFDLGKTQLLWLALEVALAIIIAYGFYLLVEKPSLRLSKKVFYRRKS
jgi:exopolysaccharide production protein ExoZ